MPIKVVSRVIAVLVILCGGLITTGQQASASSIDYTQWEQVLNTFVSDDGFVNYESLKQQRGGLDSFINTQIKAADISQLGNDEQMAFWINAYNALTLQLIIDHYPLRFGGIRTINWGRPWDIKMTAAGQSLTLGEIEHEILRKWDPIDARIHFAINCASISCPKLQKTHFDPARLDEQLDQAAVEFVNDPERNRLDRAKNVFYHSAIFDWFEEDFLATHPDILSYIIPYMNKSDRAYVQPNLDQIKVKKLKYDWGLNNQ